MLEVYIPEPYFSEMTFTIDVLLGDMAGLQYTLKGSQKMDYTELKFDAKCIRIKNCFFKEPLYHISKVPTECSRESLNFRNKSWQFTQMYGVPDIVDLNDVVEINSDFIASSYFMLSRWEEMLEHKKDEYGRFDAEQALCVRKDFYHLPIVNEYSSILIEILQTMGYAGQTKSTKAQLLLSHDIDITRKYKHWYNILKAGFEEGDLKVKELWKHISNQEQIATDPFFNFSNLSEIAITRGLTLTYYFAAVNESKSQYDIFDYKIGDRNIKDAIRTLIEQGHNMGLHPSYHSYNNETMIMEEKARLEEAAGVEITRSRQHYLRYDVEKTPALLQNAGIKQDSSMHYGIGPGFRTGACTEHSMYDIKQRKKLSIRQQPLIFMDTHLIKKPIEEILEKFTAVSSQVHKYGGLMTVLWHNNNVWPESKLSKYITLIDHFQNQYN